MRYATVLASGVVGGVVGAFLYNRFHSQKKEVRPPLERLNIQDNYMEKFEAASRHALRSMINTQLQQQSFSPGRAVRLELPFSTGDSLQAVKNATVMMSDKEVQTATFSYAFSKLLDSTVDAYLNKHVFGTPDSIWSGPKKFTDQLPRDVHGNEVPVFLFITDEDNMWMDENMSVLNRVCAGTQLAIIVISYEPAHPSQPS